MKTRTLLALAALALASACSQPSVAKCAQSSDCPPDAICVAGICQKGVPSGGAAASVGGSARLSGGTFTMDAVVGQPVTAGAAAGTRTLTPAEQTR